MVTTLHSFAITLRRKWPLRRSLRCAALMVGVCEITGVAAALADEGDAEPIARCAVHVLTAAPQPNMAGFNNALLIGAAPVDDPMLDYHPLREAAPSENQPATDADRLRILITGPGPPRVIEFTILVDGEPFRARRDAWIDRLIEQAPAEQQMRKAGAAVSDAFSALGSMVDVPVLNPESTKTRVRATPTLRNRLVNFLAAVGGDADRREVVAMLNQWPAGPAVTVLSPARSWQRAGDAPLLAVLDADGDGGLSAKELGDAANSLAAADLDQDGIVTLTEMRRRSPRLRGRRATAGRLATVIDPAGDWRRRLGRDAEGLDAERIARGPADLQVTIRFGESAGMELSVAAGVQPDTVLSSKEVIGIELGPETYELSAAEPGGKSGQDTPDQIAVGAVLDGRPLLRRLDADNDSRLTAREQRRLPSLLKQLDRDADGALAINEIPQPVRITIGRGAIVHQLLDTPTTAIPSDLEPEPTITAPDWFLPMDANRDGELSRDEFPGDTDQFRALDTDGDGLISAAEATAVET